MLTVPDERRVVVNEEASGYNSADEEYPEKGGNASTHIATRLLAEGNHVIWVTGLHGEDFPIPLRTSHKILDIINSGVGRGVLALLLESATHNFRFFPPGVCLSPSSFTREREGGG